MFQGGTDRQQSLRDLFDNHHRSAIQHFRFRMPKNLELKARYPSLIEAMRYAEGIGAHRTEVLHQKDTYFLSGMVRLKLREIRGNRSEVIAYRRPDTNSIRYSDYAVVQIPNAREVRQLFAQLFGIEVVVKKKRILYLYKNARIHIDFVRGLGNFVEFEVLVVHGKRQAESLMNFLRKRF